MNDVFSTEPCGCKVVRNETDRGVHIEWCAMHGAERGFSTGDTGYINQLLWRAEIQSVRRHGSGIHIFVTDGLMQFVLDIRAEQDMPTIQLKRLAGDGWHTVKPPLDTAPKP